MWTPKQALAVLGLFGVWIVWYIICGTDMEEGYQYHIMYQEIYQQMPIDLLDLEVKRQIHSCLSSMSSASK